MQVPRYVLHLEDGLSKWGKGEIGGGGLQKLVQELVEKVEMGGNREGGDGWVQDRR